MNLLVIFPCYNEEDVLKETTPKFFAFFEELIRSKQISEESKICFVDDGSTDKTWELLSAFKQEYILAIKLSNNFGQFRAFSAGMETFKDRFDSYVTLDVDLQDDYTIISQMIEKRNEGYEVIQGAKNDRSSDSFIKKVFANIFYKLIHFLGVKNMDNTSDFRMISNRALIAFLQYKEYHIYMKGIFPIIGFKNTTLYYKRLEREAGESKYSLKKLASLAWDITTSFSTKPLKIVLFIGVFSIFVALLLLIWATSQLLLGKTVTGWFSMIAIITFFGGVQTLAIGLIGEYIGKIYMQSKNRPRFIIEEVIGED